MASELIEWRPFSDFAELRHRLDQAFRAIVRRECRHGSFARSMVLPKGVRADDIEAKSEDGVLEVIIPVPPGTEGKRKFDVKQRSE